MKSVGQTPKMSVWNTYIYIGKIRFGRLGIDLLFLHAKYLLYFVMSLLKGLAFPSAKLN